MGHVTLATLSCLLQHRPEAWWATSMSCTAPADCSQYCSQYCRAQARAWSRGHLLWAGQAGGFPDTAWKLNAGLTAGTALAWAQRGRAPSEPPPVPLCPCWGRSAPGHGQRTRSRQGGPWGSSPPEGDQRWAGLRGRLGYTVPGEPRKMGPHPDESEMPGWPCSVRKLGTGRACLGATVASRPDTPGARAEPECFGVTES